MSIGIGSYAPQPLLHWSGAVGRVQPSGQTEQQARQSTAALTPEQQAQVAQLSKTDREVRQHEQAHMAAGAGLVTSGASYSYTRGPDGRNYAQGGEVGIDTSEGGSSAETLAKAQQIQAAAMAPAQPSGQDHAAAARAAQMAMQARVDQAREQAQAAQQAQTGQPQESRRMQDMLPYGVLMYQQVMSMAFGRVPSLLSAHA